jgi:hypothetical protein
MDYVRPYQENYKNKTICDWSAGYPVAHEKEAPLLIKKRNNGQTHFGQSRARGRYGNSPANLLSPARRGRIKSHL